jgi:hypothetical protein
MTLAHQSLLMLVLLVTGAVAVLPVALRESRLYSSPALRAAIESSPLRIVETPQGRWLLHGVPRSPRDLERLLRQRPQQQRVHYLPSDALPFERVTRSLRWLRGLGQAPVVLELPPGAAPLTP